MWNGTPPDFLSDGVDYTGFDLSSEYVKMASRRYGNTGRFIQASVDDPDLSFDHQFDTVLCGGLLHHLDDKVAGDLLLRSANWVAKGGRLVTYDTSFLERTGPIARWLMKRDRGQHVRTPDAFRRLAEVAFQDVEVIEIQNLNRIPYDICAMICTKPRRAS